MKYLLYLITYLSQYTESFMSIKEYRLHYNDIKVSYYYRYILYIYTSDGVIVQNQRNWFVHTIYKTQYGFNRNVYWNSKQNQYMRFVERLWKPWSYLDFFNLFMRSFRPFCLTCYLMLKMKKLFILFCFVLKLTALTEETYIYIMCDMKNNLTYISMLPVLRTYKFKKIFLNVVKSNYFTT